MTTSLTTPPNVFVYNETEVVLTGRTAVRKVREKYDTLHEITPKADDCSKWTKWVHYDELYKIVERPPQ